MSTPASNAAASPPQLSLALGLPPPHQSFKRSFQQFGLDVDGEDDSDLGHANHSGDNNDGGGLASGPASSTSVSSPNNAERERGEQRNKRARSSDFRSEAISEEGGSETSGSDTSRRDVARGELSSSSASLSSSSYSSPSPSSSPPFRSSNGEGTSTTRPMAHRLPTPLVLPVVSPVASLSFEPRTPSVAEFVAERLNHVSSINSSPSSSSSFTSALTSLSPPANAAMSHAEDTNLEDFEEEDEVSSVIHHDTSPVLPPVPFANGSSLSLGIAFEEFQRDEDDNAAADDEEGDNDEEDGEDQLLEDESGDIEMSEVDDMATEGALGDPIDPDRRSSSASSLGFRIPSPPLPDPLDISSVLLHSSGPALPAPTSRTEEHISSPVPLSPSSRLRQLENEFRTSRMHQLQFEDAMEYIRNTPNPLPERRVRAEPPPRLPVPQIDGGSLEDALSFYNRVTNEEGPASSSTSLRHRTGPAAPLDTATSSGVQPPSSRRGSVRIRSRMLPHPSRRPWTPPQLSDHEPSPPVSQQQRAAAQLNEPSQDESTSAWMSRFLSTMDDHRDRIMSRLREEHENSTDLRGFLEDLNNMIHRFEPPPGEQPSERVASNSGDGSANERNRSSAIANRSSGSNSGMNRPRTDANPPLRERIDVLLNQLDSSPPLLPLNLPTSRAISPFPRASNEAAAPSHIPVHLEGDDSSDSEVSWSESFRNGLVDVSSRDREIWDELEEDPREDLRSFRAGSTPAPPLIPHRQSLPSLRSAVQWHHGSPEDFFNHPFPPLPSASPIALRLQLEREASFRSHQWSSNESQRAFATTQNDPPRPPVLPLDLGSNLTLPSFFADNQSHSEYARNVEVDRPPQHNHSHYQMAPLSLPNRPRDRSSLSNLPYGPPASTSAYYQLDTSRTVIGHQQTQDQSPQRGHNHRTSAWYVTSSSHDVSDQQQPTQRDSQSRITSFPFLSFLAAARTNPSPPVINDSMQADSTFPVSVHDHHLDGRRSSLLSSSAREQDRSSGEADRIQNSLLRQRRLHLSGLGGNRSLLSVDIDRNELGHSRQRAETSTIFPSPTTLPHEHSAGSLPVPPLDRPLAMSPPLRAAREPQQSEQSGSRPSSHELLRLLYPEPVSSPNNVSGSESRLPNVVNEGATARSSRRLNLHQPEDSVRLRHSAWGTDRNANGGSNIENNRISTLPLDSAPPILPPLQFENLHGPSRSGANSWAIRNLETLRTSQDIPAPGISSSASRVVDDSSGVGESVSNSWRLWENHFREDTDRQRLHNMLTRRYRAEFSLRDRARDGEPRETSSSGPSRTQGFYHTTDVYTPDGPNTTRHRHHDHAIQRTTAFDVWQRDRERERERERRERERRDREHERERQRQRETRERERERLHDRQTLERALDPFGRWDGLSGSSPNEQQRIEDTLDIMSSDPIRRRPLQWINSSRWDGHSVARTPPSSGANRHNSQPHRNSDTGVTHVRPPSPPVNDASPYPGRRPRPRARFARHLGNPEDIHSTFLNVFRLGRRGSQRNLGDFVRDEDFDSSYEGLMALAATLGDVKSRSTPSHVISALPTGLYKDWQTADSDSRCPICLDDYKGIDPVLKAEPCNHWFHKECLEQWLHSARTCPVCRTKVNTSRTATSPPVAGPSGSNRQADASQNSTDNSDEDEDDDLLPLIDPAVPIAYHQLRRNNNHPPL